MTLTINKTRETSQNYVYNPVAPDGTLKPFWQIPEQSDIYYTRQPLWNENTKAVLAAAVENMDIKPYTFSVLKDDNSAIAASQKHLIGLMKYYEGDKNHYYEAVTTPYKDSYGNSTGGFGELTSKPMTQEQAYEKMCRKLEQSSDEVRNLLNKRLGAKTYENLPDSIKELLIDFCYNKGLGKISGNQALINAVKTKDYSSVIANSAYLYSGKKGAEKDENPGLYRRSLSRAILGARDLKGRELEEAKSEIKKLYDRATACYQKNKVSTLEIDKIYEQFTQGKISAPPVSAESYKINIDEKFKGKGILSIAKTVYNDMGVSDMSFEGFYNELLRLNNNPEKVNIGQELKIPYVKISNPDDAGIWTSPWQQQTNLQTTAIQNDSKKSSKTETEGKGGESKLSKLWGSIKNFFKSIGKFFSNLFFGNKDSKKEDAESEEVNLTPFQKMVRIGKFTQFGDLQLVSTDYEVKKGDNLWNLSRTYATADSIICNDNKIADKNNIQIGQILKIQKLGYKIQKGDNLYQIAKRFGLSVEMLKDLNNIEDVNKISADSLIEIPGFIYEVKEGDALSKISSSLGIKQDIIKRINHLEEDDLKAGQKIIVLYNDSDFAVSTDKKNVVVDKATGNKIETIDMSNEKKLASRPLLQKKNKVNGETTATRKVFAPTRSGKLSDKTIIVNAGHGYSRAGIDCGTPSPGDIDDEWLLNYDNAIRLKDRLCAQGARVIFIQGHVNLITEELEKKNNKADLFISIHVNSCDKMTQDRTQIYSSENKLAVNKKSQKLANIMENNFDSWIPAHEKIANKDKFLNPKDKSPDYAQSKQANYAVIREAEKQQNIPAVLWEVAFMISPKGRKRLADDNLMNNYSDIMAKSVVEYFS